jgi:hypothetical protein
MNLIHGDSTGLELSDETNLNELIIITSGELGCQHHFKDATEAGSTFGCSEYKSFADSNEPTSCTSSFDLLIP